MAAKEVREADTREVVPPSLTVFIATGLFLVACVAVLLASLVVNGTPTAGMKVGYALGAVFITVSAAALAVGLERRRRLVFDLYNRGLDRVADGDCRSDDLDRIEDGLLSAGAYRQAADLAEKIRIERRARR